MKVVVVESPSKAKTINKYLGEDYKVIASYGHVRDLPSKNGAVNPEEDFALTWEVHPDSEKHLKEIASLAKKATHLYLATDPDREGEGISWHIANILEERKVLKDVVTKRIVFNEITKKAILEALNKPRDIDPYLIDAYMARRILDYLVGFNLSPVLWRKLPGSRSAGRVQSVALRLITDREQEIEKFKTREYWSVQVDCSNQNKNTFSAKLNVLDGKKLDKFDLFSKDEANKALKVIEGSNFSVDSIEKKRVNRNPQPPFTTSTLQQEASRKLGFSVTKTMQVAQKLYEGIDLGGETVGLITYMRTDSVQVGQDAVTAAREGIVSFFGEKYLPKEPRLYKTKAKNAQEAHEAIRPTDISKNPKMLENFLSLDQKKLYDLIWKRMITSQMASAEIDQVGIDIASEDKKTVLRATGSTVFFDGFLKVYEEGKDDQADDGDEKLLPIMVIDEKIAKEKITPSQHFTQPPPRYSEASLVKKMEELGIGRPSTYASILQVLQDRQYVRLDKKVFFSEDRGRVVTAFLCNYFGKYVEFDFTAKLEDELDQISDGKLPWKKVIGDFWNDFKIAVDATKTLTITQVLETLETELSDCFFPKKNDEEDPRKCPSCATGRLGLRLGKFGAFIGCTDYPTCSYTKKIGIDDASAEDEPMETDFPRVLGNDPKTGREITLKKGPYGIYVEMALPEDATKKQKPKRASLPKGVEPSTINLETALPYLALPRLVGIHPETGEEITANVGPFGPYVKHKNMFVSLKKTDSLLEVDLTRALELIKQKEEAGPSKRGFVKKEK